MKIGILSMQRVNNYGSFLQSYALKKILEEMGHEIVFIDIEFSNKKKLAPHIKRSSKILSKTKYLDKYLFKRLILKKKNKQLNETLRFYQKKYFNLDEELRGVGDCDAVVIGSDEIFNCDPNCKWGITGQRFGNIAGVPLVFTYAASCGYSQCTDVSVEDRELIRVALSKLKGVSVRDKNTELFVNYFIESDLHVNLDPVLIYNFEDELKMGILEGIPNEPYMLIYAYHNRISSAVEIKAIKRYAKENKLKTIAIGGSLPWCDEFAVISPFQVLGYFKMATCIVTDTFHGTVLAAKYNKPLAVLIRDSNYNKLGDLVQRIHILNHQVKNLEDIDNVLSILDNYEYCNYIIREEQNHTIEYLKNIVGIYTK